MSLPAMLLGETVGEIIEASQFARNIIVDEDPKTPVPSERKKQHKIQNSEFHARRMREKQVVVRSESAQQRAAAKSRRINLFKVSSSSSSPPPPVVVVVQKKRERERYIASRVSPRNRPWATKTVLFPNPLFHSPTSNSNHQKVIARQTPHKFLIKSPPLKLKNHHRLSPSPSPSPSRTKNKSPSDDGAPKLKRPFSPSRFANRLVSPLRNTNFYVHNNNESSSSSTGAMLRRSFSPSRLANRFVSPLKNRRKSLNKVVSTLR